MEKKFLTSKELFKFHSNLMKTVKDTAKEMNLEDEELLSRHMEQTLEDIADEAKETRSCEALDHLMSITDGNIVNDIRKGFLKLSEELSEKYAELGPADFFYLDDIQYAINEISDRLV